MRNLVSRPGISDLICLGLLALASVAGALLEPPHRDLWLDLPLFFEVPLLCTALLLLSRSGVAGQIATVIHILMLVGSGLYLVLAFFLLVTILFAGTAVVIGPAALVIVLNSVYTLRRISARRQRARPDAAAREVHAADGRARPVGGPDLAD
jgi:hypothetical protein